MWRTCRTERPTCGTSSNDARMALEPETLVLESDENKQALAWSSDGRYILYSSSEPADRLRSVGLASRRRIQAASDRADAVCRTTTQVLSPNRRWVCLRLDRNRTERDLRASFPWPRPESADFGWGRQNGRAGGATDAELFYVAPDNRLMAVSIVQRGSEYRREASARLVHVANSFILRAFIRRPTVSGQHDGLRGFADHDHPQLEAARAVSLEHTSGARATNTILTPGRDARDSQRELSWTGLTALIAVLPLTVFPAGSGGPEF